MNGQLYKTLYSTGYKCYALTAKQNEAMPYIIYTMVDNRFETCASGSTGNKEMLYQIDIYSKYYDNTKAMADDVITALNLSEDFEAVIYSTSDTIEDGGTVYRTRIEINLWKQGVKNGF